MTVHALIQDDRQDDRRIAPRFLVVPSVVSSRGSEPATPAPFARKPVQPAPAHPRTDALHARPGVAVRPMRGVPRALSSSPDIPTFKDDTR